MRYYAERNTNTMVIFFAYTLTLEYPNPRLCFFFQIAKLKNDFEQSVGILQEQPTSLKCSHQEIRQVVPENDNDQAPSLRLELEQVNTGGTEQGEFLILELDKHDNNVDTDDMPSLATELKEYCAGFSTCCGKLILYE